MATVSKSNLENIAQVKRDGLIVSNDYNNVDIAKEYNEIHKDAKSDGDIYGKGTGVSMGYSIADTSSFSIDATGNRVQKMSYSTLITQESGGQTIGGKYDREGNPSLAKSGRNGLATINKFSSTSEYGEGSVDTTSITINMGKANKVIP